MKEIEQAMYLVGKGQVEEAITLLQKIQKDASDDHQFLIAELYEQWGYAEDAVNVLNDLLMKYPNEGQIKCHLAEIYIDLNKDDLAFDLLLNIQHDDPYFLHSLMLLADLNERQGLFEVAEQKLLEAKRIAKRDNIPIIDFALAELLFSIGQVNRAVVYYEKVLKNSKEINEISIIERLAESYALFGDYETALTYYAQLNSDDSNLLFKYGFTALQAKKHDVAINLWQRVIEIDPHYYPVYYELAAVYALENKYNDAYEIAKQGMLYDEFDKRLYFLAGKAALELNNVKEAEQLLEEAISLDEDYKDAILLYSEILQKNNRFEEVLEFLLNTKVKGAEDPLYDWELAKVYNELEQYEEARKSYEEANIYLANDCDFLRDYGFFLLEDGKVNDALNVLSAYLKLEPHDEETNALVRRLDSSNDENL